MGSSPAKITIVTSGQCLNILGTAIVGTGAVATITGAMTSPHIENSNEPSLYVAIRRVIGPRISLQDKCITNVNEIVWSFDIRIARRSSSDLLATEWTCQSFKYEGASLKDNWGSDERSEAYTRAGASR